MNLVEEVLQVIRVIQTAGKPAIIWLSREVAQGLYPDSVSLPEKQETRILADADRVQLERILNIDYTHTTLVTEENIHGHHSHWWSKTALSAVAWHYASWSYDCVGAESHFLVINLPPGDFQDATRLPAIIAEVLARKTNDVVGSEIKIGEARKFIDLLVRLSERQYVDPLVIGEIERSWKELRLAHLLNGHLLHYLTTNGRVDELMVELEGLAKDLQQDTELIRSHFWIAASRAIDHLRAHLEYRSLYDYCPAEIFFGHTSNQKLRFEIARKRFEAKIAQIQGWLKRGRCILDLECSLEETAKGFRIHLEQGHRCSGKKSFWQKLFKV